MSQEPTTRDARAPAPPVISITEPQDDLFDADTRDFLEDWESKHTDSSSKVSQAEFFAPTELKTSEAAATSNNATPEDDDVPLHPSAPRIVISEPDEIGQRPISGDPSPLKQTLQLSHPDGKIQPSSAGPRSRQRRHSTISVVPGVEPPSDARPRSKEAQPRPTARPWISTEIHPRDGLKMKVRRGNNGQAQATVEVVVVYLYNSATCNPLDRDADLAAFDYPMRPKSREAETSPTRQVLRAHTELPGKRPHAYVPDLSRSRQWETRQQTQSNSQNRHVNWLKDSDMLQQQLPGMRLITIGFDIRPVLSSALDFDTAGRQLHTYLRQHRMDHGRAPMIFLGHTFGGMFIIKALSIDHDLAPLVDGMLPNTAGIFLFSNYTTFSDTQVQALADLYGARATDKMFDERALALAIGKSGDAVKDRLSSRHPSSGPPGLRTEQCKKDRGVSIGFPIFQVFARGETDIGLPLTTLLAAPVRTININKEPSSILKYSSPQDLDFRHLGMLIQSAIRTHKLLHAAAGNRVDEIHSLIRRGTNVNLRDRWSQTASQIAVRLNHEGVVSRLLGAKNVDANVRDRIGNTPLHYAVRNANENIVNTLIHNGADIGLENQRKRTPRDLAEKHKSRKHIAELLKGKLMNGPDQSPSSRLIGEGKPPSSDDGILACKNSQITITEIYATGSSDKHWSVSVSVEALLYGKHTLDDILQQVRPQAIKRDVPVCVWVHVPENNMVWVEDLFAKLRLHPAIWQDTRRSVTDSLRNRAIIPHFNAGNKRSLFLPYISYEANVRQAKRTTFIQAVDASFQQQRQAELPFATTTLAALTEVSSRASKSERRPLLQVPEGKNLESYPYLEEDSDSDFSDLVVDDDPDDLDEEEKALVCAYLYNPPALHVRRTLDQYYYHMLESTQERDIDQVVSRWAQNVVQESRHNILMVDQLWLWTGQDRENAEPGELEMEKLRRRDDSSDRIRERSSKKTKDNYIISCFPNRTGSGQHPHRGLDDLRLHVLDPSSRKRDPIRQPEDLVSRILETCCSTFDRMQDVQMLRFFQMFEDSVGTIDDKESRLFRDFQRGSNRLLELDHANKHYNKKMNALLTDLLDIREEISLLVEVKDIRDEVNIILTVLNIQRTLVAQMGQVGTKESPPIRTSLVESMILRDINDFTKLDSQARTIQDKLNALMDLKQKAANAWEAKEARETAVAAGKQGNTVLVFTVVTIIFLPLSFMSSFFAVGIAAFPHNADSGEVDWPLETIMGIMFGVSLCVSIPLIIFALNMDYFTTVFKELRYNHLTNFGMKIIPLLPPLGSSKDSTAYRRRWTKSLQRHRADYMKDDELNMEDRGTVHEHEVDTKQGATFPSTASSQTLTDDNEDSSSRSRRRFRRYHSQKKTTDDETLVGGT